MKTILLGLFIFLLSPVLVLASPYYSFSPEILALEVNDTSNVDLKVYGASDTNAVEVILNYSEGIEISGITEGPGLLGLNKRVGGGVATIDVAKAGGSNFAEGEVTAVVTVKLLNKDGGNITVSILPPDSSGADNVSSSSSSSSKSSIEVYSREEYEQVFGSSDKVTPPDMGLVVKIVALGVVLSILPALALYFFIKAKRARAIL
jgi:hypothetical protein